NYLVSTIVDLGKTINIFRIDPRSGAMTQLTFAQRASAPSCSPDGKWMVYHSRDGGRPEVFKLPIDGGKPQKMADLGGFLPSFSADGKMIVFRYNQGTSDDYHHKMAVIPATGGTPLYTFELDPRARDDRIVFAPDSKGLVYPIFDAGAGNLWMQPLTGGPLKQLTFFKSMRIEDFAFSPDGKTIALLRGGLTSDVVLIKDAGR